MILHLLSQMIWMLTFLFFISSSLSRILSFVNWLTQILIQCLALSRWARIEASLLSDGKTISSSLVLDLSEIVLLIHLNTFQNSLGWPAATLAYFSENLSRYLLIMVVLHLACLINFFSFSQPLGELSLVKSSFVRSSSRVCSASFSFV